MDQNIDHVQFLNFVDELVDKINLGRERYAKEDVQSLLGQGDVMAIRPLNYQSGALHFTFLCGAVVDPGQINSTGPVYNWLLDPQHFIVTPLVNP